MSRAWKKNHPRNSVHFRARSETFLENRCLLLLPLLLLLSLSEYAMQCCWFNLCERIWSRKIWRIPRTDLKGNKTEFLVLEIEKEKSVATNSWEILISFREFVGMNFCVGSEIASLALSQQSFLQYWSNTFSQMERMTWLVKRVKIQRDVQIMVMLIVVPFLSFLSPSLPQSRHSNLHQKMSMQRLRDRWFISHGHR